MERTRTLMQVGNVVGTIVFITGAILVGYGVYVGDEATWRIAVEPVPEDELREDIQVTEYDYLEPQMQDAFRKALQSDAAVQVSNSPADWQVYVHYRDDYYRMDTTHGDAAQTTMVFSIGGGIGAILVGSLGWYLARRWRE